MKKFLLVSILVFSLTVSYGQTNVYQPFPNDSAAWFYESANNYGTTYSYTEWLGDTVINSIEYKKVFVRNDYTSWAPRYAGGIRQDIPNEKIYSINLSGVEQDISVNQHLLVGDTLTIMPCSGEMLIAGIDSVLIGSKFHKRYNLICTDSVTGGTYIVGVGEQGWGFWEGGESLLCFSVNNVNQYGNAPYCQLVSVNELSNRDKFSVFPNPFCTQTTMQAAEQLNNATLTVDNCFGQTVAQIKNISGHTITFNRDNLPNGLYLFRLTEDKIIFTAKLLIVD